MPSKKKSAVEVLTAEPKPKPTREQVVTAKHTVVYEAPEIVQVPVDEGDEDENENAPAQFIEEIEQAQRQPTFRQKIRDRFKARGIGVDETLSLRIDRLPLYEQNGLAGVKSEKEFCGVIACTEKFFDTDEYLIEIQRRYGPGEYWLTVRHKNSIVNNWRERVGGFPVAAPVVTQSENGQPQVIYQQPGQPAAPPDAFKEAERALGLVKKYAETFGYQPNGQQPPQRSDDEVLAGALLKQPEMIENIVGGLVTRFGKNRGGDDEPSWTAVAMEAIRTGQAQGIIQTLVREVMAPIKNIWSPQNGNSQQTQTQAPGETQIQNEHAQPPHMSGMPPTQARPEMEAQAQNDQQQISPERQAFNLVIDHCQRKLPPRLTLKHLIEMEERLTAILNHHALQTGQLVPNAITVHLDLLAETPIDEIMAFVKTLPNGEAITALPHARQWTEQLQRLIKESQQEEGMK